MQDPKIPPTQRAAADRSIAAFSWKKRGQSFKYAWRGLVQGFKTQHNMWLHALAAIVAIGLGLWLHISESQWLMLIFCMGLVVSLELVNTAIEALVDHLHPQRHPKIALVKDLAAAAVLVAAIISLIIGCLIFGPALIGWLH